MDDNERRALIRIDDLDQLEGLNERHRQVMRRIEAELEASSYYDRPSERLYELQAQAARVRREAVTLLERLLNALREG